MEPAVTFDNLTALGDRIYLCEVNNNLSLYHYVSCDQTDDNMLKQVRGIIFDNTSKNLVLRGFPFTPEYVVKDLFTDPNKTFFNDLKAKLQPTMSSYRFFTSYEGTILRVFCHNDIWHVSTHKRIDAKTSHWGGPMSFEEFFRAAIDKMAQSGAKFSDYDSFFSTLDITKHYMFLLTNTPQTRIVSEPLLYPKVYLVGVFVNNHFTLDETLDGFTTPPELKPRDFDHLYEMALWSDPMVCQGVVAMSPELGFYKLVSPVYNYLTSLRGNESNLKLRYLQLRKTRREDFLINDFCRLFSEHDVAFKEIEALIRRIAKNIHNTYIKRFVRKQFAVVPPEQYGVLKKCHSLYNSTKEFITFDTVMALLDEEPALSLLKMISSSNVKTF